MWWDALVRGFAKRGELDKLHRYDLMIVNEVKRQLSLLEEVLEDEDRKESN